VSSCLGCRSASSPWDISQLGPAYPGLLRAADLIGQLADIDYLRKTSALFAEFSETGVSKKLADIKLPMIYGQRTLLSSGRPSAPISAMHSGICGSRRTANSGSPTSLRTCSQKSTGEHLGATEWASTPAILNAVGLGSQGDIDRRPDWVCFAPNSGRRRRRMRGRPRANRAISFGIATPTLACPCSLLISGCAPPILSKG
jgi:hypothetical protein